MKLADNKCGVTLRNNEIVRSSSYVACCSANLLVKELTETNDKKSLTGHVSAVNSNYDDLTWMWATMKGTDRHNVLVQIAMAELLQPSRDLKLGSLVRCEGNVCILDTNADHKHTRIYVPSRKLYTTVSGTIEPYKLKDTHKTVKNIVRGVGNAYVKYRLDHGRVWEHVRTRKARPTNNGTENQLVLSCGENNQQMKAKFERYANRILLGENVILTAIGYSGSGKTLTLLGDPTVENSESGMIAHIMRDIVDASTKDIYPTITRATVEYMEHDHKTKKQRKSITTKIKEMEDAGVELASEFTWNNKTDKTLIDWFNIDVYGMADIYLYSNSGTRLRTKISNTLQNVLVYIDEQKIPENIRLLERDGNKRDLRDGELNIVGNIECHVRLSRQAKKFTFGTNSYKVEKKHIYYQDGVWMIYFDAPADTDFEKAKVVFDNNKKTSWNCDKLVITYTGSIIQSFSRTIMGTRRAHDNVRVTPFNKYSSRSNLLMQIKFETDDDSEYGSLIVFDLAGIEDQASMANAHIKDKGWAEFFRKHKVKGSNVKIKQKFNDIWTRAIADFENIYKVNSGSDIVLTDICDKRYKEAVEMIFTSSFNSKVAYTEIATKSVMESGRIFESLKEVYKLIYQYKTKLVVKEGSVKDKVLRRFVQIMNANYRNTSLVVIYCLSDHIRPQQWTQLHAKLLPRINASEVETKAFETIKNELDTLVKNPQNLGTDSSWKDMLWTSFMGMFKSTYMKDSKR